MRTDYSGGIVSRIVEACISILLAAVALWAAVEIIFSIWVALCVGLLVAGAFGGLGWILFARFRRW